ncbi:MAG: hypothetical protein WC695_11420 [Candidatus Omnitrophota bacterium]
MKSIKILTLIMFVAMLSGCWEEKDKQERDCNNPRNKQEQQDCALEAFTKPGAIPDTLPTNNKKW